MSKNYCFRKDNLDDITKEYMGGVLSAAMNCGISNVAPLGFSGDDFYMYGRFINKEESDDGSWTKKYDTFSQDYNSNNNWEYVCSECGRWTKLNSNYCPNCGAKMDTK